MRPGVVVLGFVLGSAAAISFALAGTAVVFIVLRAEYPRLDSELGALLTGVGLFLLVTAAAGASFYSHLKDLRWRHMALACLTASLAVVVGYYALV